ncbi:MAG: hypothetical protein U0Q47_05675 [Mycobacterium sp.]
MEALIVRGLARYRLEPVLPELLRTPLRLHEPTRRMAELVRGDDDRYIFNIWHEKWCRCPVDRHLVPLLDGTRDRDTLVDHLLPLLRTDVIRFYRDGRQLTDEAQLRSAAAQYVDETPQRLEAMGLLRVR